MPPAPSPRARAPQRQSPGQGSATAVLSGVRRRRGAQRPPAPRTPLARGLRSQEPATGLDGTDSRARRRHPVAGILLGARVRFPPR